MSEVQLVIRDARREIQDNRHGSFAEAVIAALSAEPETIEELDAALERFMARDEDSYFNGFSPATDVQPYDAGLVIVDLAARLVVCESTYSSATSEGMVAYHDGKRATDLGVRYHLSEDWLLTSDATDWQAVAKRRRRDQANSPPLDARAVLYGEPLLRFIAEQCFCTFRDQGPAANPDYEDPRYQQEYDLIREIHIRWLMSSRKDLRGQTPREVMLTRRDFVNASLSDREEQWSLTEHCPPGLEPQSAAFRFAGFGTHETVVYYDLLRELLWSSRREVAEHQGRPPDEADLKLESFVHAEIPRLAELRERWLDEPFSDTNRTARNIIHNERARIPEGESGEEAMIEDDCPLCQMQADLPGPVFWHLDGSHMDNDFAFSIYEDTYEEWEREQRRWEEFDRRFAAKEVECKRLGVKYPGSGYSDPDVVWKMSFSKEHSPDQPLLFRLFAIGSHLGELIVDLREGGPESPEYAETAASEQKDLISRLTRLFGKLRKAVRSSDDDGAEEGIGPVLVDFCQALDEVRSARSDLALKCTDLRDRLRRFLERPSDTRALGELLEEDRLPS